MAGRRTLFKPEYVTQARMLCERIAATENDLAMFFGVATRTIWRWKTKYPEFGEAIKLGLDGPATDRVERALYQRAVGFYVETEKIFAPNGIGQEPTIVKTREYFPPDTNAARYWLNNRRPEDWRERQVIGVGGEKPGDPVRLQPVAPELTAADHAMMALLYGG